MRERDTFYKPHAIGCCKLYCFYAKLRYFCGPTLCCKIIKLNSTATKVESSRTVPWMAHTRCDVSSHKVLIFLLPTAGWQAAYFVYLMVMRRRYVLLTWCVSSQNVYIRRFALCHGLESNRVYSRKPVVFDSEIELWLSSVPPQRNFLLLYVCKAVSWPLSDHEVLALLFTKFWIFIIPEIFAVEHQRRTTWSW